ncbi:D-alanyl-D-alanine carboxypeptidase/D-alanyl-D-alanine-endopeptidase [Streptomyces aculeolatus]|uniref:D-alanyl-D-alanine carboxypeptidase/D-alanyl-D-alanine endopeptidase n=1 Tax=Streptomyces aculeolatus TaxID=270689 RepID=UPI001CED913D|nr:D-alanyl-D-alanine carboxypeptidase/D-alanyl-D-alanine-endopeptidase [Streptomyces aculeolatus]
MRVGVAVARRKAARWARHWTRRWEAQPLHTRRTVRLVAASGALGGVLAGGLIAVAGPWDSGQRTAEKETAARADAAQGRTGDADHGSSDGVPGKGAPGDGFQGAGAGAPRVLTPLGPQDGTRPVGTPRPTGAGLARELAPLLKDPALGSPTTAAVWDVTTGRELYGERETTGVVPASTVKLATGAAALAALGPDHRIPTASLAEGGEVFLVGGGDPTLSAKRLKGLARDTARKLKKDGVRKVAVRYDATAYAGDVLHEIGPNENIAPVTPLMVNEARLDDSWHGPAPRATDPARDAADDFAGELRDAGVRVAGEPKAARVPERADELAATYSAPLAELTERMLTYSDNDLGEALARQTAIAVGRDASFEGAGRAVAGQLKKLGLPVRGARFADGSGISRGNRVSADLLARLLVTAADQDRPELRSLLTGLPVAGFNGTLRDRYGDGGGDGQDAGGTSAARGVVRAKTGTLTGVNSLAGTVVDADGRLLAFAFFTMGATDRTGAGDALDRMAAAVAACGCR